MSDDLRTGSADERELFEDLLSVIRPIITSLSLLEEALAEVVAELPPPGAPLRVVESAPGGLDERRKK